MTHFATKIFIEMYDNVYFDDVEMKTLEEMEKFWPSPRRREDLPSPVVILREKVLNVK